MKRCGTGRMKTFGSGGGDGDGDGGGRSDNFFTRRRFLKEDDKEDYDDHVELMKDDDERYAIIEEEEEVISSINERRDLQDIEAPFTLKEKDYTLGLRRQTDFTPDVSYAELETGNIDDVATCSGNRYSVEMVCMICVVCVCCMCLYSLV